MIDTALCIMVLLLSLGGLRTHFRMTALRSLLLKQSALISEQTDIIETLNRTNGSQNRSLQMHSEQLDRLYGELLPGVEKFVDMFCVAMKDAGKMEIKVTPDDA